MERISCIEGKTRDVKEKRTFMGMIRAKIWKMIGFVLKHP